MPAMAGGVVKKTDPSCHWFSYSDILIFFAILRKFFIFIDCNFRLQQLE